MVWFVYQLHLLSLCSAHMEYTSVLCLAEIWEKPGYKEVFEFFVNAFIVV